MVQVRMKRHLQQWDCWGNRKWDGEDEEGNGICPHREVQVPPSVISKWTKFLTVTNEWKEG